MSPPGIAPIDSMRFRNAGSLNPSRTMDAKRFTISAGYTKESVVKSDSFEAAKTPLVVTAYPNPYSESFSLGLTTSSIEKVGLSVYDMTGRLIEQREVGATEVAELQVGNNYPSGVYNVIVTQGNEVKTLRVIKR